MVNKGAISEMLDWNQESAKGSDYAKAEYVIHVLFISFITIGLEFFIGISPTLSGIQKASLGLFVLFGGVALVVFGRVLLELFQTIFKVERQLNVLQDLGRQNRIRPNLELIESQLKEISSRNTEEIFQPILLQIERHLATPKEIAQPENLLPALERIYQQLESTRLDYSRGSLDATLRNIEQNLDNLSQKEGSDAGEPSLQPTLDAIAKYLEEISSKSKPKKRIKKALVKKVAKKKAVKKTINAKSLMSSKRKSKPISKITKSKH
jgi:hypothetical protein